MKPLILAALLLASDGGFEAHTIPPPVSLWQDVAESSMRDAEYWRSVAVGLSDENANLALALRSCQEVTQRLVNRQVAP